MQVQIEFWQLVMALAGLVASFAGVVWLFGTILVRQFKAQLDQRFTLISSKDAEVTKQLRQFEKDFSEFQIAAPTRFVLRDDYIRGQSVLEAKQDALFNKMEVVRLEIAAVKGGHNG